MGGRLNGIALIARLDEQVASRHLLKHPFYQAWTAGQLDRRALRLYAAQYYHHVQAFPEHLRRLTQRTSGTLRALIEENLAEEENSSRTHPQLWRDFAVAIGVEEAALDHSAPLNGIRVLVETYRKICAERPACEAVAALYAYEAQVPEIAAQKLEGLIRFYGIKDPRGLAYFAVHEEADVRHRAAWRSWLMEQAPEEASKVLKTADKALQALWGALNAVYPHSTCAERSN